MHQLKKRKTRIDNLIKSIISGYNERKIIDESFILISKVQDIDRHFKKIYIRPMIDAELLIDDSVILDFRGFGVSLALGEENYFVNRIMEYPIDKTIEKLEMKNIEKLAFEILTYGIQSKDLVIIAPLTFVYKTMWKKKLLYWDNNINRFRLNSRSTPMPIYTVNDDEIKDNLFVLNRGFASWTYKEFDNGETIFVAIGRLKDELEVDVYARSEVKFLKIDEKIIYRANISDIYDKSIKNNK